MTYPAQTTIRYMVRMLCTQQWQLLNIIHAGTKALSKFGEQFYKSLVQLEHSREKD